MPCWSDAGGPEAALRKASPGPWRSNGNSTACRLGLHDGSADGKGTTKVYDNVPDIALCKQLCEESLVEGKCWGIEYEASAVRCELWTAPIGATATKAGFECWHYDRQDPCLCLFGIDRTLTGRHGAVDECPGNVEIDGVSGSALQGGTLVLSALGAAVEKTFCGRCYQGIVSAGSATGSQERAHLRERLTGFGRPVPDIWSSPININSPLIIGCANDEKARCAYDIVGWYKRVKGVDIYPGEVYVFDDFEGSRDSFAKYGFNALQVSCGSRDDEGVGLCGARPEEVVRKKGISICE
jgi:hypothetical protein